MGSTRWHEIKTIEAHSNNIVACQKLARIWASTL